MHRHAYDAMIDHCISELPNEGCGILSGNSTVISRIWKMKNIDASPESFMMDPEEINDVLERIHYLGEQFMGVFHSHPSASPYPSKEDMDHFHYQNLPYFIVSLASSSPDVQCYYIRKGKAERAEFNMI
nr:M67 family metallopeptidase [Melghiribacillus thermohalophilus]